jgi:type II secretory pathway pseudopilin PulG
VIDLQKSETQGLERPHIVAMRSRAAGTSLIEVLVAIVVLLIGILAIAQIFPRGFKIMTDTREQGVAHSLTQDLLQWASNHTESLPEQILPVDYALNGTNLNVVANPNRNPSDYTILGDAIDKNGIVSRGGLAIGYWPYVSGPNIMRRIIGEAHRIPSVRSLGNDPVTNAPLGVGGLLQLNFGPILTAGDTVGALHYNPTFDVYGEDMIQNEGVPPAVVNAPIYEYYLDQPNTSTATLYLPKDAAGGEDRKYRVKMSVWIQDVLANVTRRDVSTIVSITAAGAVGYQAVTVDSISGRGPTDIFLRVDPESVRVAREFVDVTAVGFHVNGKPDRPYEYMRVNQVNGPNLGQLLFSPAGYNYFESRPSGRVPLIAKVDYDVFDWRVLHEDLRIPDVSPDQVESSDREVGRIKLAMQGLRVEGNASNDGTTFNGLNIPIANFNGGVAANENRDFIVVDDQTGGIFLPSSYRVDKSAGVLRFLDKDGNPANGLQMDLLQATNNADPLKNLPITVNASGRTIRVFYMGRADWSVQLLKAASQYLQVYGAPGAGQYYVGGSGAIAGSTKRIYFPPMDLNQKVRIGTIYYVSTDPGNPVKAIHDADFILTSDAADPLGLPFLDITSQASDAQNLDSATNGFAVQDVQGVSVTAKTLYNNNVFGLTGNTAGNLSLHDDYRRNYHRSVLDTVLQRAVNQ